MKFTYCSACGAKYQEQTWPRTCNVCGDIHWKNPVPVVAVIQPTYDFENRRLGYVVAQRGIQPCYGQWALVGGYVDMSDADLVSAARREFQEETGLVIEGEVRIVHTEANHMGNMQEVS